jgi:hypothetical protein
VADRVRVPGVGQEDVEEPRAGDLAAGDPIARGGALSEGASSIAAFVE